MRVWCWEVVCEGVVLRGSMWGCGVGRYGMYVTKVVVRKT